MYLRPSNRFSFLPKAAWEKMKLEVFTKYQDLPGMRYTKDGKYLVFEDTACSGMIKDKVIDGGHALHFAIGPNDHNRFHFHFKFLLLSIMPNEAYAYGLSPFNEHCVLAVTSTDEDKVILGSTAMKRTAWAFEVTGDTTVMHFAKKRESYVLGQTQYFPFGADPFTAVDQSTAA